MSTSPTTEGVYIFDASTFLTGLRSISLRNLSLRSMPAAFAKSGRVHGERDSTLVTSASLRNLQAVITTHDAAGEATVPNVAANGMSLSSQVRGAAATSARDSHSPSGAVSVSGGTVLLTTGVSQPTVNPTWPVSETASSSAWLQEDANVGDLDSARLLMLRVFAVDQNPDGGGDKHSNEPPHAQRWRHGIMPAARVRNRSGGQRENADSGSGSLVWECAIDVRGLTALPEGSRLSDLSSLPADCLLVEMSNGGLYAPDWVVQALSKNSALPVPEAAAGGRSRSGGGGGDTWRDDSDEEADEGQEPLDQVLRRVLQVEEEAERGRAELAAHLEKAAQGDKRARATAENALSMETLRLQLSNQEELLEVEEAALLKEKQHLQAETLAVEELLKGLAEAEEAAAEDARHLESEKRETLKSHVLLEARRARLTAELQAIYPIKYHDTLKEYTIRGLELPADLYSMDDERISSALGYTAHLVCMLAKYLQIPLRYQVIYNASRSAVRDNVTGAGVAYPLFRKGVEKERFDRGVYLLGRDVEQMLTARGVPAKRGAGQLLRNLERLMSIEGV